LLMEDVLHDIDKSKYSLVPVTSYEEGFEALSSEHFDACFLDYKLGGCNGIDLLKNLAKSKCDTPIIMLTNFDSPEVDKDATDLGAKFFLSKQDINPTTIERTLRYILQHQAERDKLKEMAYYDELSGLLSRRVFFECLGDMISRCHRAPSNFFLVFIDLDDFKSINDNLGHEAGDIVIKTIGERLKNSIRNNDIAARIGGDEFVIVFEGVPYEIHPKDEMLAKIHSIIEQLSNPIRIGTNLIKVGVSYGVSCFPDDGSDPTTLLSIADGKLYTNKGRNQDNSRNQGD
ncbi:MAG: diguanylate cyclase, partial [Pseudomonadales bacterium]|nr:diguanylate cyclase [Pseudomonadales bacterium]